MQNRSMFPYRRHGPKKRVKHGPNRNQRGPQKGLPNSARDLLPMLQPATKALAQVLAGRAGASGQLGHARTMLAQAERMIAERAHNRLTPAEREEFFEQLARLKLTLADADVEAEVQAGEQQEPRPAAPPVAHERLKEMALALSARERPSPQEPAAVAESRPAGSGQVPGAAPGAADATPEAAGDAAPAEDSPERAPVAAATGEADARGRNRLTLPKGTAEQAVQALAFGSGARRRSRVTSRAAVAAFAAAKDEATKGADDAEEEPDPTPSAATSPARATEPAPRSDASPDAHADEAMAEGHHTNGASIEGEAKPEARAPRRTRKAKHQGVPEGWVIDEEGFVVPGAG
jgi:hypothetical protein